MGATSNLRIQTLQNQHTLQLVDHIKKKRSPHRNIGLIVGIDRKGQRLTRHHIGTGLAINKYVILSAAHMFYPPKYYTYQFYPYKLQHRTYEKPYYIHEKPYIPEKYIQYYQKHQKLTQEEKKLNFEYFEHDYSFLKLAKELDIEQIPYFSKYPYGTQDINRILKQQGMSLNLYAFPNLSTLQRGGQLKELNTIQELKELKLQNRVYQYPNINSLFYFERNFKCLPGISGSPVWLYADSKRLKKLQNHANEKQNFDKMILIGMTIAAIKYNDETPQQTGKQKGKQHKIAVMRIITPQIIKELVEWMKQFQNYQINFIKNSQGYLRSTNRQMYEEQQQASVKSDLNKNKKIRKQPKPNMILNFSNNQSTNFKKTFSKYHVINRFIIKIINKKTQKIVGVIEYTSKQKNKKGEIKHYAVKYDDKDPKMPNRYIEYTNNDKTLYVPPDKALTISFKVQQLENGQKMCKIIFQPQRQEKVLEQISLSEYMSQEQLQFVVQQFCFDDEDENQQMVDVELEL